jgi:hypothetical protein
MPSGCASFVTMVQTADFRESDHVALGHALNASRRWRVFRQRLETGTGRVTVHGRTVSPDPAAQVLERHRSIPQPSSTRDRSTTTKAASMSHPAATIDREINQGRLGDRVLANHTRHRRLLPSTIRRLYAMSSRLPALR